jgi:hypothetical protein
MKASHEDIMQEEKLRKRFLELASSGLPSTEMLNIIPNPAMYAKELGNHPEEMKFHYHHNGPYKNLRNGPLSSSDL